LDKYAYTSGNKKSTTPEASFSKLQDLKKSLKDKKRLRKVESES
jgi:hypothetical protein